MASNGCWLEENMKEQIKLFNEGRGNIEVNETRIMWYWERIQEKH